jgi:hypothetical protein
MPSPFDKPFFYDSRRDPKATILVRMTPEEARLAPEALRHVAGGVFEDSRVQQERLRDLAQAIEVAIKTA